METEEIREFCLKLKGSTEDMKWGEHLVFSVGEKMYCMLGLDQVPVSASFKASDEDFEEMSKRKGFQPAPYMARNKWIYTDNIANLSKKEWQRLLKQAYEIVKSKLPKKTQRELEN